MHDRAMKDGQTYRDDDRHDRFYNRSGFNILLAVSVLSQYR